MSRRRPDLPKTLRRWRFLRTVPERRPPLVGPGRTFLDSLWQLLRGAMELWLGLKAPVLTLPICL